MKTSGYVHRLSGNDLIGGTSKKWQTPGSCSDSDFYFFMSKKANTGTQSCQLDSLNLSELGARIVSSLVFAYNQ